MIWDQRNGHGAVFGQTAVMIPGAGGSQSVCRLAESYRSEAS